jgi:hypothetical protein
MSRAYRVKVRETLRQVIRAEDHIGTRLELLEILPREATAELLRRELIGRGFQPQDKDGTGNLVRRRDGVTITIDPEAGTVTVRAESDQEIEHVAVREGTTYDDSGRAGRARTEEQLREGLRKEFEQEAQKQTAQLQRQVTDRLERHLLELQPELDQVANRVTAEALKLKAAQIGQIKEMTEDPQTGSLTIVLEV